MLPDSRERSSLSREYAQAWIRNQFLLGHVTPALNALHAEGIQTLLLKGAALALTTYERPGLRPFGDVDVLVRPDAAAAARACLERCGWAPFRRLAPSVLAGLHGLGYTNAHGVDLDLHWHALAECSGPDVDHEFWNRAVPLQWSGAGTHVLSPADQLLHVCTHGGRFTPIPTAHWIADATTILQRAGDSIAWDTFISEARARRLTYQLRRALLTVDPAHAFVPSHVIGDLETTRRAWWEHLEFDAKRRGTRPSAALLSWCAGARSRDAGAGGESVGFVTRLQAATGSGTRGELATRVALALIGLGRRQSVRELDMYGRRIQIETDAGVDVNDVLEALNDRLPPFAESRRADAPDRIYHVLPLGTGSGYRALVNRESLAIASTLAGIADEVATDLQTFLAITTPDRTFVHAGVVSLHGRAIVLPGESGSGKSTLVAALIRAGATYASDEFAVLDGAGRVYPYARPLTLRRPGRADEHVRPRTWRARTARDAMPVGLVLFAAFHPDGAFDPRRVSRSSAMLRLLNHCPGARERPAATMASLRALVAVAPAWTSKRGETDAVVQALLTNALADPAGGD